MKNGNGSETGQVMFMRGCTRLLYSAPAIIRQREGERVRACMSAVFACVKAGKSVRACECVCH